MPPVSDQSGTEKNNTGVTRGYMRYWIGLACIAVLVVCVIILLHPRNSLVPSASSDMQLASSTVSGVVPLAELAQEESFASSLGNPYRASDQEFTAWTSASPASEDVPGADPATFQCVYQTYSGISLLDASDTVLCRDASHVYLYGGDTVSVDPSTVSVIAVLGNSEEGGQEYLLKDKDHVYLFLDDSADGTPIASFKILPADPQTVEYLGDWLFKDKSHVFGVDGLIDNAVDATSFVSLGGFWFKDKNALYCDGLHVVSQADPSTFRVINNFFGADTQHVYVADGSDPSCSVLQGVEPGEMIGIDAVYAKDSKQVYFGPEPIGGIIVPPQGSASWADATQFTGTIDPSTFTVLTDEYVKDASHVFSMDVQGPSTLVVGADAPTFTLIDENYEKDKGHVYWRGEAIPGVNPATFVPLGNDGFSKDGNGVYFYNTPVLPDADVATFSDIGFDPASGERYAKDATHVYACGYDNDGQEQCAIVKNANPATFTLPNTTL